MGVLREILSEIKDALLHDAILAAYIKKVLRAQSGYFPKGTPFPCIVVSPDTAAFDYRALTSQRGKSVYDVVVYGYADFPGQELGLIGEDGVKEGVIGIGDDIDRVLHGNTFGGLVQNAQVMRIAYPIPPQQWFMIGLNEVRVYIRYTTA